MSSPVPTSGKLSDISTCEILAFHCRGQGTGVLTFSSPGVEKSVYIQKGKIVFATSRDPDDRLGELLLTRGVITRDQMEQASSRVGPGKRLGTILVEMGFLPASDLPRWVMEQVKEIIFSLFSWGEGDYRFDAGPLPTGEVITLNIPSAEVFLTGLRRVQKWSVLRKGAGEIQIPYRLAPDFRQLLRNVRLEKAEESLLHLLESGCRTMEDAARNSSLTTLFVYQIFYAFRVLGVLLPMEEMPVRRTGGSRQVPSAPAPVKNPPVARPQEAGPAASTEQERPLVRPKVSPSVTVPPGMEPGGAAEPVPLKLVKGKSDSAPASPDVGAQTVMLSPTPAPALAIPQPVTDAPPPTVPRRKHDYKVVRLEGDALETSGTSQIEALLGTWSKKGYSLAGVVQGRTSGLFSSAPPSFFIFLRD